MNNKILIIFLLLVSTTAFTQEVFIKQCWGEVNYTSNGETKSVNNYEVYKDKLGVFTMINSNSKLWIRIGDDTFIIQMSETKNKFSVNELLSGSTESHFYHEEDNFIGKVLSLFSFHESGEIIKVSDMMLSSYGGVNRGDNNVYDKNFGTLHIMEGMPFMLDWGILQNDSSSVYVVILTDDDIDDNIIDTVTLESFLVFDTTISNRISTFTLNVLEKNSGEFINGKIETYRIRRKERETLWKLRDLAVQENKKDKNFYQIIFIDALINKGLICNAAYYKWMFNDATANQQLKNYLINK